MILATLSGWLFQPAATSESATVPPLSCSSKSNFWMISGWLGQGSGVQSWILGFNLGFFFHTKKNIRVGESGDHPSNMGLHQALNLACQPPKCHRRSWIMGACLSNHTAGCFCLLRIFLWRTKDGNSTERKTQPGTWKLVNSFKIEGLTWILRGSFDFMWATKNTLEYFPLYWLFNRDPDNALIYPPWN